jgi:enoyl-[acyl-carrier protein] reductase I
MLAKKAGVVIGFANRHSLAWGVAQAWHKEGAALTICVQSARFRPALDALTAGWPVKPHVVDLDVTSDAQVEAAFASAAEAHGGRLDMLLHAVAYASPAAMKGPLLATTRADFAQALDVSSYSFLAVARAAAPLFEKARGGSITTLSYLGASRVVPPYRVMGCAKACLEALARGLAVEMGPQGVRVNVISPGPVNTLAARGIAGFTELREEAESRAPLRRGVSPADVGALAAFLASDAGAGITGATMHVDAGLSALA